jgi:hypothetical protein
MLRGIRHEYVGGNSRLEGLQVLRYDADLDTGYSGIAWQNFYDLGRRWIGAVQALHNTTEAEPLSLSYGNAKYASG